MLSISQWCYDNPLGITFPQVGAATAVLLAGVARRAPLTFAAVKGTRGHCEPAAGAAGVHAAIEK